MTARSMAEALEHRGPDDGGEWVDAERGIALGFRRLAILDLSAAGHQPMLSASGRYVIAFNGEVYNFARVRAELESAGKAPSFRGHSDTEVILAAVEAWGLSSAVKKFIGMFAFALWDRREQRLHLVRDRAGVKPLYFGHAGATLLFGSELKAFHTVREFRPTIHRGSLSLLLRLNYIPAPHTIYNECRKLEPGTIATFIPGTPTPVLETYWTAREAVEAGARNPIHDEVAAEEELDELLRDAIGLRMVSDVPLGVLLSGGIDSSLVASLMQVQNSRPIRTFTIGFNEVGYNEAQHAREVARHLGTDHTELYVTSRQALDVIPKLASMYDEPFADSSQIPTYLVSKLARTQVTVALSGDGGDELFGGYNRYFWGQNIWKYLRMIPQRTRTLAASGINTVSPAAWSRFVGTVTRFVPAGQRYANAGDKLHKLADVLNVPTAEAMYLGLVSHWKRPGQVVLGGTEPLSKLTDPGSWSPARSFPEWMMFMDLVTYLPDDILVKVDRASMAVSLEAREPLLDHRIIEFAWRLPLSMKMRGTRGKWILRKVLHRYVPASLMDRPKMGFGIPLDSWLRGPLRDWAEALLDPRRLKSEGYFDPAPIEQLWREHLSGSRARQYPLWNVLMFQAWLESSKDRVPDPV